MSFEELSEKQRKLILASISSNDKKLQEDVARVRQWLQHQPHLPSLHISDQLIESFLVGSKGIEIAKERLDGYFAARSMYPQYFLNMDPDTFRLPPCQQTFFLPRLTSRGYRVIVHRITQAELEGFDHLDSLKRDYLLISLMIEQSLQAGIIFVFDLQNVQTSSLSKINISACSLSNKIHKCGMPLKVKKIIILNAPTLVAKAIEALIFPFLNKKLLDRLVIKSERDLNVLKEFLEPKDIPEDMGGLGPSSLSLDEEWRSALSERRDWCLGLAHIKSDETRRPKHSKDSGRHTVTGTFRNLSID